MKIIAKIAKERFLVEINESEIAACCGYESTYDDGWNRLLSSKGSTFHSAELNVGMTFQFKEISAWHRNLQYKQKEAKQSAGMLRSLADMIEHACPETFLDAPVESAKVEVTE